MKKLLLLLSALVLLSFASCDDDCDCPSGPSETKIETNN